MTSYTKQLRRVPGLHAVRRREIDALSKFAERLDVQPGQAILAPGDRWTGTCIIEEGEASAQLDGWAVVLPAGARIVRTGAAVPTITVRAETPVRALLVGRNSPIASSRERSGPDQLAAFLGRQA
jgi:hypothetical protein